MAERELSGVSRSGKELAVIWAEQRQSALLGFWKLMSGRLHQEQTARRGVLARTEKMLWGGGKSQETPDLKKLCKNMK
jgi:hypothetical protein